MFGTSLWWWKQKLLAWSTRSSKAAFALHVHVRVALLIDPAWFDSDISTPSWYSVHDTCSHTVHVVDLLGRTMTYIKNSLRFVAKNKLPSSKSDGLLTVIIRPVEIWNQKQPQPQHSLNTFSYSTHHTHTVRLPSNYSIRRCRHCKTRNQTAKQQSSSMRIRWVPWRIRSQDWWVPFRSALSRPSRYFNVSKTEKTMTAWPGRVFKSEISARRKRKKRKGSDPIPSFEKRLSTCTCES